MPYFIFGHFYIFFFRFCYLFLLFSVTFSIGMSDYEDEVVNCSHSGCRTNWTPSVRLHASCSCRNRHRPIHNFQYFKMIFELKLMTSKHSWKLENWLLKYPHQAKYSGWFYLFKGMKHIRFAKHVSEFGRSLANYSQFYES